MVNLRYRFGNQRNTSNSNQDANSIRDNMPITESQISSSDRFLIRSLNPSGLTEKSLSKLKFESDLKYEKVKEISEVYSKGSTVSENLGESFENENNDDFQYIENNSLDNFLKQNLSTVLNNSNSMFQNINYPNVLSHELIKRQAIFNNKTNECSLRPDVIFDYKKNYYNKIQTTNASSYFIYSENSNQIRENYVNDLKEVKNKIDKVYENISSILDLDRSSRVKNNFGNKLSDFYLSESKSKSIGKIASIILNNKDISSTSSSNSKNNNRNITNFFYNNLTDNFDYFDDIALKKIFDIQVSQLNTGSSGSYIKGASAAGKLLNTDKLIGQSILNLSVSLNGFYKDSIDYDLWSDTITNSVSGGSLYETIDSEVFSRIPILKLESILSLETSSSNVGIFSNLGYDDIYTKSSNIFDLSDFIDPNNYFLKDTLGNKSSINSKTFNFFKENSYLTNRLSSLSYILPTLFENNLLNENADILSKEENASFFGKSNKQSYKKFIKYFNPFYITEIHVLPYNSSRISRSASEGGDFISTIQIGNKENYSLTAYFTDLSYLQHNLINNKNILQRSKEKSEFFNLNDAKIILGGTKFLYFTGKSKNSNFVKNSYNTNNVVSEEYSKYKLEKIGQICTSTRRNLQSNDQDKHIRQFIDPVTIDITQNAYQDYYIENKLLTEDYYLQIKKTNPTKSYNDFAFKRTLKNLFKGENQPIEIINSDIRASDLDYIHTTISNLNNFKTLEDNKNLISLTKGFALFKNTQNKIDINRMSDKFVLYDSTLTLENEFMKDRLICKSSSYNQSEEENTELIFDSLKENGFKKDRWEKIAFDLRRNIYDLKKSKAKKLEIDAVLDYLNQFKVKAKNVKKTNGSNSYISLLYSNEFENSLDTYDSSDFVSAGVEGDYFKKFDFSNTQENIENTFNLLLKNQGQQIPDFGISSNELKEFLSYYYTNSEIKSSSTYFNHSLYKVCNIIKSQVQNNFNETTKKKIAYDKLLSDAVLFNDSKELNESLALSALFSIKSITNPVDDNFEEVNKKSNLLYQGYLEKVYSYENIQRQKSYTLRIVDFPSSSISLFPDVHTRSTSTNQTNASFSDRRWKTDIVDHEFNFGVMPGKILSYTFPLNQNVYNLNVTDESLECVAYRLKDEEGLLIANLHKFKDRNNDVNATQEGTYEYIYSNFYNYDSYLDSSNETLGENITMNNVSFNETNNSAVIGNIIRKTKVKNSSNENDVTSSTDFRDECNKFTNTEKQKNDGNAKTYESIEKKLNYTVKEEVIKDYCYYQINDQPPFKSFINDSVIELMKYIDQDFENNTASINNFEDALKYVKNFEEDLSTIFKIIRVSCNIYSSIFDIIVESSILSNINNNIESEDDTTGPTRSMWNANAYDVLNLQNFISYRENIEYSFEKQIKKEEDIGGLYTNLHAEIELVRKLLNNSDVLEIMTFDTVSSFLTEFDRFRTQNSESLRLQENLQNISSEIQIDNVEDIITSDVYLNILSKKLNDYAFYQSVEFVKVNQRISQDFSLELKDHFKELVKVDANRERSEENLNFFGTILSKEKDISLLAEQGINLTNDQNLRYDIIRLGIDYNIAELLYNNKLLKIKCNIVNHKYPNIYIPPLFKFYTPMLTDIVPSHIKIFENLGSMSIDKWIGLYDLEKDDLMQRYNVVRFEDAVDFVYDKILGNINNERIFRNESTLLANNPNQKEKNAIKIVTDAIFSSAIKYSNYRSQKPISEDDLNDYNDEVLILRNKAEGLFSAMSQKDFEETFSESHDKAVEVIDTELSEYTNFDKVKNQLHFVEFFNLISEYTDGEKIGEIFTRKRFYDIFSFIVSRNDIKDHIEKYYLNSESEQRINSIIAKNDFFNSFSYIIEAEVI